MRTVRPTVLSSFVALLRWSGSMKRSKFTTREGLLMLLGAATHFVTPRSYTSELGFQF